MPFTIFCVYPVVTIMTALVTLLVGMVISEIADEDFGFGPWLLSVMALGFMLTKDLVDAYII